jgi:hypothetical protein
MARDAGMTKQARGVRRTSIRLRNSLERPIALVLEPWGEIVRLEAGATYEAAAEGPPGDTIELDVEDGILTLWAPNDSSLDIRNAADGSEPTALADGEWQLLVPGKAPAPQLREAEGEYDATGSI